MPKFIIPTIFLTILLIFFLLTPKTFAAITFSISNPQTNSEQTTFDVSISGLTSASCPEGTCYLQAAFTGQNKTKYFGFTKNNSNDWYKYDGSPQTDYIKSTFFSFVPNQGDWSGKLTLKVDTEDKDYEGPGTYNIKTWRYSGKSTSSAGSSDNILSTELSAKTPDPTPSPQPLKSPSSNTKITSPAPFTTTTSPKSSPTPVTQSSNILGEKEASPSPKPTKSPTNSPSPSPQSQETKKATPKTKIAAIITGSGTVLIGLSIGLFLWYKHSLRSSSRLDGTAGLKRDIKEEEENFDK